MRQILAQGRDFVRNSRNRDGFEQTKGDIEPLLTPAGVVLSSSPDLGDEFQPLSELDADARRRAGHLILQIYFRQLLGSPSAVLDLRADAFQGSAEGPLAWSPSALYVQWDPAFIAGLRDVYAGFYLDDRSRFDRGLLALGLEHADDLLLTHLGGEDQRRVRFTLEAFQSSFHALFVRCRDRNITLHRNFLALGIDLVCLYDALQLLGGEFDVRDAFEQSYQSIGNGAPAC